MSAKKIIRDLSIILLITFGLLIIIEIILRVIFPKNIRTQGRPKLLAYEFNEDYLVRLKPNIEKTITKEESGTYTIYWKTNKDSFRGNELKEKPKLRIIVYGDSSIEARYSKLENTYVQKLENYLRYSGIKDIEAINGGVVGFGPDQSLIRFAKEVDIYNPDIIIFSITTHNDFGDIIRNRLFELDSKGNFIETGYKKTVDPLLIENKDSLDFGLSLQILKVARNIKRYITRQDAVERKANDSAESLIQRCYSAMEREYSVYKQSKPRCFSIFGDCYDLDIALSPDAESSKTKIKLMDGIIKNAKNIADKKGIGFVVLILPSVIDLTENFDFSYKHLEKYTGYRKTNLTNAVKNICISNRIAFINLFDIFSKNNPEDLFFKGRNDHWNDQGQEIAARETALYVIKEMIPKNRRLTNSFRQGTISNH
jgi:hypothetical protein